MSFTRMDLFLFGPLAVGAAALLVILWGVWSSSSEYSDRFLIPAASVWLISRRWPAFLAAPIRAHWLGLLAVLAGCVAFPLAWYLFAQVGTKTIILWWLLGSWLLALAGVVLVRFGAAQLYLVSFPLLFVLFSLPMPDRIRVPLQAFLQEGTTRLGYWGLSLLGYSVERLGFVLRLPHGDLGVADACSGVRSVTALLAVAALVAYLKGFSVVRGLLLLVVSVPLIALVNGLRVLLSGIFQEAFGQWTVEGIYHEALGIVMIFIGLGITILAAKFIEPLKSPQAPADLTPSPTTLETSVPNEPTTATSIPLPAMLWPCYAAIVVMLVTSVLSAIAHLQGQATAQSIVQFADLDSIPKELPGWTGKDLPIPEQIHEMLTFDRALLRAYRNSLGQEVAVWVIYWAGSSGVKGYHHPDVCWPNRGWITLKKERREFRILDSQVPITVRHFQQGGKKQWVAYWTQEGPYIWTEADEQAALAQGDPGHRWITDRLSGRSAEQASRIVVLFGTDLWDTSGYAERKVEDFVRAFGSEVYKVCPWAVPQEITK